MTTSRLVRSKAITVVIRTVLSGAAGVAGWFVLTLMWYTLAPTKFFFQYHAVTATGVYQAVDTGAWTLVMESDLTIHRAGELTFRDELECQIPGGGSDTIHRQELTVSVRPSERYTEPWLFELPLGVFGLHGIDLPTICRTEHLIRTELPTGQHRVQVIVSNWFEMP